MSYGRFVHAAIICMLTAAFFGACGSPPLRVRMENKSAVIDVQTLGEYLTTVRRIRLSDAVSRVVIWELKTKTGEPQIHDFVLKIGTNDALMPHVQSGDYDVVVPKAPEPFVLEGGHLYFLEVWGKWGEPATATLKLGPRND